MELQWYEEKLYTDRDGNVVPTHPALADFAKACYDEKTHNVGMDVEVMVKEYGTTCIIAIRGSEAEPTDWIRNFMAFPWRGYALRGFAPYGFLKGAQRLSHYLMTEDVLLNAKSIWLTGHSLGGAIGILAAQILWRYNYPVKRCVAFGAPRTGSRVLDAPVSIYDHAGDPVVKVPWFWDHPVMVQKLPDVTDGPLQHAMKNYCEAMEHVFNTDNLVIKEKGGTDGGN